MKDFKLTDNQLIYTGDPPSSKTQALEITRNKWLALLELARKDINPFYFGQCTCGLCMLYLNSSGICGKCPVAKDTGKILCRETPLEYYLETSGAVDDGNSPTSELIGHIEEVLAYIETLT